MYSAMAEHEECVAVLLRRGALITSQDNNGQTALHWAALTGSYKCLKMLLAQAADVKIRDVDGRTPLHLATSHSSSKVHESYQLFSEYHNPQVHLYLCSVWQPLCVSSRHRT